MKFSQIVQHINKIPKAQLKCYYDLWRHFYIF